MIEAAKFPRPIARILSNSEVRPSRGKERHIAAPRTAVNTGNGTQAALDFRWLAGLLSPEEVADGRTCLIWCSALWWIHAKAIFGAATRIGELKRRNVFRVGAAYAIVAWLLVEVASVVLPNLISIIM